MMKCLTLCLLLAFSMLALRAAPLTLVADGKAMAAIVVAVNEPKGTTAAQALQKYLAKMSGVTLPIVKEGDPLPVGTKVSILVGHTIAAAKLKVKVPAGYDKSIRKDTFMEEGYVLRTKGNSLVVGGNSDGPYSGTIFAAYALLEKLGCRWYFPGDWGEVIPKLTTVTVPDLNITTRPDFSVRGINISGWVPTTPAEYKIYDEWAVKIGFSQGDFYPVAGDGFLAFLVPPKEYFAKHPEYFAMNKQGQREAGANNYERDTMLCMSNPEVLAESIKNLKDAFAGKRQMRCVNSSGVGISPPDGAPYCYCDKCLAASQNFYYPTYTQERMQSDEFFGFASKLAAVFPDKWVGTAGYALREVPPQGVKLPPNVEVMYAPISSCVLHAGNDPHCWRRQETMKILADWSKLTHHITIYDYNPCFLTGSYVPERDVANFAINAPLYKQLGSVKGFVSEGRKAFMQTWISYYMRARLMWDVHADVNALKKDFYTTFFGPEAGPSVQAWWDACEVELNKATIHCHEDWLVNNVYTVDFTKKIHAYVESARQAKMTDEQRGHFAAFALIADHLESYAAMEDSDKRMDYAAAAAAAGNMLNDMRKLQKISPFLFSVDEKIMQRSYFCGGRQLKYLELAAKTGGAKGTLVAALPLEMKFTRDRFNAGVIAQWYDPKFDDHAWDTENTFYTWDAQDKPEDDKGHDYDGYGWYRGEIDIPAQYDGKPIRFWDGGAINEAWVWINGEYVGHKAHAIWWMHPHDFELDVTKLLHPGKNTIAIRVFNDEEIGGLYRRGFFWTPKE